MKKLLIIFGGFVVLLFGVYFGVGAALSGDYEVIRSKTIEALPEKIYELVGHLDRWPEWTTWNTEKNPGLVISYPGKCEGAGAVEEWSMKGGEGKFEITSAETTRGISYDLSFDEGAMVSEGIISFEAKGATTLIVWRLRGSLEGTASRWFGLFLVPMLEDDLEECLEGLERELASCSK